jgi:hypothetical protein
MRLLKKYQIIHLLKLFSPQKFFLSIKKIAYIQNSNTTPPFIDKKTALFAKKKATISELQYYPIHLKEISK